MTHKRSYSRRKFIGKYIGATTTLLCGGLLWNGCEQKKAVGENKSSTDIAVESCDDLSGVSENDIALREKLGYVKESPINDNKCNNCNLYLPPAAGKECGGCMLFKGPVYAEGYCTYWAPQV